MEQSANLSRSFTVSLGVDVQVPYDSVLKCPMIHIGDHTRINGAINIRGSANCSIGNYCAVGYGVTIVTTNHIVNHANIQVAMHRKHGFVPIETAPAPVEIGHNVWIGDDVTILASVKVGNGAVLGAGSVVTRDVPAYSVCYGSPARVARERFNIKVQQVLEEQAWWFWSEKKISRNSSFFNAELDLIDEQTLRKMIVE